MKIYELNFDVDHYRSIQLCEEADVDYYQMFDGTSLAKKWKILKVKEYEEDKKLKIGDAPGFNIPVLNRKALDILFPLIKDNVEILPLQFKDELLYGINVLKILDAINYDLSEYMTFRDGKKIMAFDKYVFKEEMVKNNNIFKIKDIRIGLEFVSEEFYNCVIDNKLEGFDMRLVYETNFECASCNKESNTGWEENGKMKSCFSVVRDVEDDIYGDIQRMASEAAAVFRIQNLKGEELVAKIKESVDHIRKTGEVPKQYLELADVSVGLGCLYGNIICSEYGWKWQDYGDDNHIYHGIISPRGFYSHAPMEYMHKILTGGNIGLDGKNDNTILLLYNMIKDIDNTPEREMYFPLE